MFVFITIQKANASLEANPSSIETIENHTSIKNEKSPNSEDPVFQETGGLYTEEDFENATPMELPEELSTNLTPSNNIPSVKNNNKEEYTPPIDDSPNKTQSTENLGQKKK